MKKVSIIVPVYNGANYIMQCISDLMTQTYSELEVVLVDDGSVDESSRMIGQLQREFGAEKIRLIRQANGGICKARNTGINHATGAYIMFMDQDDRMHPNAVRKLVNTLEGQDADLAIGGYELIDEQGKILKKITLSPKESWSKFKIAAPWGRIFKKDILDQNQIRFMETKISADFYFNLVYMSYCNKIAITEYRSYGWTYRKDSESHANMSQASEERNVFRVLTQTIKDMKHSSVLSQNEVDYMMIKHVIWYLYYVAGSVQEDELETLVQTCFDWLKEHIPSYRSNPLVSVRRPVGEEAQIRMVTAVSIQMEKRGMLTGFLKQYRKISH